MKEITKIETPFRQKFGIPRQPLLVEEAWGRLKFPKNNFYAEAFRGIEGHTHLWLIFQFSEVREEGLQALVSPPRFEGKKKLGVFATRTPHRPNRIGLSVVKFDKLEILNNEIILHVKGVDLLDQTPIFDIKPYVPYCDSLIEAKSTLFEDRPTFLPVRWECDHALSHELIVLIEKIIGLDPRPSHDKHKEDSYGVSVAGYNMIFRRNEDGFVVTEVTKEQL